MLLDARPGAVEQDQVALHRHRPRRHHCPVGGGPRAGGHVDGAERPAVRHRHQLALARDPLPAVLPRLGVPPVPEGRAAEEVAFRRHRVLLVHAAEHVRAHPGPQVREVAGRPAAHRLELLARRAAQLVAILGDGGDLQHPPVQRAWPAQDAAGQVVLVKSCHDQYHAGAGAEPGQRHRLPPGPRRLADRRGLGVGAVLHRVIDHHQPAHRAAGQRPADARAVHAAALRGVPPRGGARVLADGDVQPALGQGHVALDLPAPPDRDVGLVGDDRDPR